MTFAFEFATLPEHYRDEFAERVAIVEEGCKVSREEAERLTLEMIRERGQLLRDIAARKLRYTKGGRR
jgi:hypothetical protein